MVQHCHTDTLYLFDQVTDIVFGGKSIITIPYLQSIVLQKKKKKKNDCGFLHFLKLLLHPIMYVCTHKEVQILFKYKSIVW